MKTLYVYENIIRYENIIQVTFINAKISHSHKDSFCAIYHLKSLVKESTCYKNLDKPACIDLILTNSPRQFQATLTLETGLSDFHKMSVAAFIFIQTTSTSIEIILKGKHACYTEHLTQRFFSF